MVVNMACPKCGGQASEYDVGKWSCLKCQNKFLYAPPPPPPATVINNSINIQGTGTFDLDVERRRRPKPVFHKRSEVYPSIPVRLAQIQQVVPKQQQLKSYYRKVGVVFIIIASVLIVMGVFWFLFGGMIALLGQVASGMGILLAIIGTTFLMNSKSMKIEGLLSQQEVLLSEGNEMVLTGHIIACPNCDGTFAYVKQGDPMPTGLKHCVQCGKQLFLSQGYSYPLVHH